MAAPELDALRARAKAARPLSKYLPGLKIVARDTMGPPAGVPLQYTYTIAARPGKDFADDFRPAYSPGDMLKLGVFSGKYLNDCTDEFPREWYMDALARDKLRPGAPDAAVNLFKVKSRKSIQYWRKKGWVPIIPGDRDARGWFQWYCRYWLGRRCPDVDAVQIKRWKSFARHAGQITASYKRTRSPPATRLEKMTHRPRQRQGLLQWSYNPWL